MSFFKSRVSFHLNFASTFTVMTRNSSDIFKLKRVICFGQRETNKVKYFRLLSALMEAHPIPYAIFETLRSGFIQNSKLFSVVEDSSSVFFLAQTLCTLDKKSISK